MSLTKRISLTQSGVDSETELSIPTGITVDGKQGWSIIGMRYNARLLNGAIDVEKNCSLFIQLNTETGFQTFTDPDSVLYEQIQTVGTVGSISSFPVAATFERRLVEPRVTVQPDLFLNISSTNLKAVVEVNVEIIYDIVKLTDVELMRLMQGGA